MRRRRHRVPVALVLGVAAWRREHAHEGDLGFQAQEPLEDVLATLDRLSQREPPLVAVLARQPGTKESRYMHLFSGDAPPPEAAPARASARPSMDEDRVARLEGEVTDLRREVGELKEQLAAFRRQFE